MQSFSTLFKQAKAHIPGGVNSPVRAFKGVGGQPVFIKQASGPYIVDENDRRYIDYVGSWGPMILGHAHPEVIEAINQTLKNGTSFGAPTVLESQMAELICELMPAIEMVRMVNSGTEATMSAIRLARGISNRDKIIKFEGCYHGHADSLLVKAGSGALTLGVPTSPGVPADLAAHTLTVAYNDLAAVEQTLQSHGNDVAAIIVEPVAGNMNCVPPEPGFLPGLRKLCDQYACLLIFDEVMTGFRVALGGAQSLYDVTPDLTTLGKIIGGGLPVGAFGGKRELMEYLAPVGPVYQAGTLSGNPLAMAAGKKTLEILSRDEYLYAELSRRTLKLTDALMAAAKDNGVALLAQSVGAMFGLFFTEEEKISRFNQVEKCDVDRFSAFFHAMLAEGVYLAPSAYEAGFLSLMHDDDIIEKTLNAAKLAFAKIA